MPDVTENRRWFYPQKIFIFGIEPTEKALPDFCGRSGIVCELRARSSVG